MSEAFSRLGYSPPFRAIDASRVAWYRRAADQLLQRDGLDLRSKLQSRHLDAPVIRELCETPAILEGVHAILGASIVLWRSNFFEKLPGSGAFEWHRDRDHWGTLLDPMINVTAWLALEDASLSNGCIEVRPRDAASEDALAMELAAGECFLFDQDIWHRSGANHSTQRRLGLAIRFTTPEVEIDRTRLFAAYQPIRLDHAAP